MTEKYLLNPACLTEALERRWVDPVKKIVIPFNVEAQQLNLRRIYEIVLELIILIVPSTIKGCLK
jgi:hypothetical protein